VTLVLATGALNDLLLAGFAALTAKANELERRAQGTTARPRPARDAD
jgi:hypothetical protein